MKFGCNCQLCTLFIHDFKILVFEKSCILFCLEIKEFIHISSAISFLAFHNRTMRFLSENMHFLCRIGHLLVAMLWKIACLCQLLNPIFVHGLIENPIWETQTHLQSGNMSVWKNNLLQFWNINKNRNDFPRYELKTSYSLFGTDQFY